MVSTGPSWQIAGLLEAAEFTGLDVEIPKQPQWSKAEVDTFRGYKDAQSKTKMGPGQAKCWLGHLHALKRVITVGWATALIFEDDVDWDISINHQLALVAPYIAQVTNSTHHSPAEPYGNGWKSPTLC